MALHLASSLSLLLLLGVLFVWIRSETMTDDIFWHTPDRMTRLRTSGGGFWFETRPWPYGVTPRREWHQFHDKPVYPFAASPASPLHERLGFFITTEGYDLLLVAPYWSLALLTAPLPLLRLRAILLHRRRRKRIAHNLCPNCGYDLRASSDKCPECGTLIP